MAVSDDKQNRLSTLSQDVIALPKKAAPTVRPAEPGREAQRTSERKSIPPSQDVFRVPEEQDILAVPRTTPPPAAPPSPPPPPTAAQPAYAPPPSYPPPGYGAPPGYGNGYPPNYGQPGYGQPPGYGQQAGYPPPQPPSYPPPARSPVRTARPASPEQPAGSGMGTAGLVIGVLALLVAVYGAFIAGDSDAGGADTAAIDKLTQELRAANERVAKLELALSAASSDAQKLNSPNQANVLQISAGMRELRDDVDGVANEVAKLTAQLGEIRSVAAAASGQAKLTQSQVEQVSAKVTALGSQVANAPKGGGAAPAAPSAETQAAIKALAARTDKMANDIRQLYRLVGGE